MYEQKLIITVHCHEKAFHGAHTPYTVEIVEHIAHELNRLGVQMVPYPWIIRENGDIGPVVAMVNLVERPNKYRVTGKCRELGAIGAYQPFDVTVKGFFDDAQEAIDEARAKNQSRYQDMHELVAVEITGPTPGDITNAAYVDGYNMIINIVTENPGTAVNWASVVIYQKEHHTDDAKEFFRGVHEAIDSLLEVA